MAASVAGSARCGTGPSLAYTTSDSRSARGRRMTASTLPDGIRDEYVELSGRLGRHANPIGVVLLGLLLLSAFLGFTGREVARTATGGGAELRWEAPEVIRNGEFFEMRIRVASGEGV